MKILFLLFALLGFAATNDGNIDYWKILSKVKMKMTFDKITGEVAYEPIFNKKIQALNGKKIRLEGYYAPYRNFILSAFPVRGGFCSLSGISPESAVYLETDTFEITKEMLLQPFVWEGTLELNDTDPLKLLYTLKNAKLISN